MAEHWFRMHANIADKPVVWRLAQATNIPIAKAIGHLAMFWGKVSQQAKGGDVSGIPDVQLEAWAGWDGKRGAFVAWLRTDHLSDGVVNEYEEYSGRLDERRERDRIRKADIRKKSRGQSAGHPPDSSDDVRTTSRGYDTIRNDTIRNEVTTTSSSPPSPAALDPLIARLPEVYWVDLSALLARVPNPTAWCAECLAALDGMHGPAVTGEQLGHAIRDYNANGADPSLRLFRGYLRDSTKPPRPVNSHRSNANNAGAIAYANAKEALKDL